MMTSNHHDNILINLLVFVTTFALLCSSSSQNGAMTVANAFVFFVTPTTSSSRASSSIRVDFQNGGFFETQKKKANNKKEKKEMDLLQKLNQTIVLEENLKRWLNGYGETSRTFRRKVFTAADWIRSRRPRPFLIALVTTFDSGLIRQLQLEVIVIFWTSFFVVFYNDVFVYGFDFWHGQHFDGLAPNYLPKMVVPSESFQLGSVALGLLLAFRTKVSYERWEQARTAWGKITSDSQSIARMGCIWGRSYVGVDDDELQKLGEAICSFSRSVMNRTLSPQEDEKKFIQYTTTQLSDIGFAQELQKAKHRPTASLAEITTILAGWDLNPIHQVQVELATTGLCDALGACERIFTSPLPLFYVHNTNRALVLFLMTLPLGLYEPFEDTWNHVGVIPAMTFISAFYLGIEELATQMEEPFSILPMEKMCEQVIRNSVMEQVERSKTKNRRMIQKDKLPKDAIIDMDFSDIPRVE